MPYPYSGPTLHWRRLTSCLVRPAPLDRSYARVPLRRGWMYPLEHPASHWIALRSTRDRCTYSRRTRKRCRSACAARSRRDGGLTGCRGRAERRTLGCGRCPTDATPSVPAHSEAATASAIIPSSFSATTSCSSHRALKAHLSHSTPPLRTSPSPLLLCVGLLAFTSRSPAPAHVYLAGAAASARRPPC